MSGRCGYRWDALRLPTPGTAPDHVKIARWGVEVNATCVPQECALPEGHGGPHRSLTNVTNDTAERAGPTTL